MGTHVFLQEIILEVRLLAASEEAKAQEATPLVADLTD